MQRTCVKCGHNNLMASGSAEEACPTCGAIYSKASAAPPRAAVRSARPSGFGGQPSGFAQHSRADRGDRDPGDAGDQLAFAIEMRRNSLYPTVRLAVRIGFVAAVVIAVLIVIGGVIATFERGPHVLLSALGIAAVVLVVAMAWRELSLMLVDLSDAAVRMAAQGARQQQE